MLFQKVPGTGTGVNFRRQFSKTGSPIRKGMKKGSLRRKSTAARGHFFRKLPFLFLLFSVSDPIPVHACGVRSEDILFCLFFSCKRTRQRIHAALLPENILVEEDRRPVRILELFLRLKCLAERRCRNHPAVRLRELIINVRLQTVMTAFLGQRDRNFLAADDCIRLLRAVLCAIEIDVSAEPHRQRAIVNISSLVRLSVHSLSFASSSSFFIPSRTGRCTKILL